MAHLCGLCLTLRDRHGHLARLVTNYDGLLVSVLVEAQAPELSPHRTAAPCALRGFARADVVDARAEGARLAAAASLALAAGKIGDHLTDRDGIYARPLVGAAARRVAERWSRASEREAASLGFDDAVLRDALRRQPLLEARGGLTLLELTEPTETAVSAVFARTGELTGKPHNVPALAEAGRFFGRLAHLLDAVEDLEEDRRNGAYNPIIATGTPLDEVRRLCDDAAHGIELAVADLDLERRSLVRALLVGEVRRAVDRTFDEHRHGTRQRPGEVPKVRSFFVVCPAELCKSCTCGCYQPKWSPDRGKSCRERFDPPCDCCEACSDNCSCNCCDCCRCCKKCDCDCDCCDCN